MKTKFLQHIAAVLALLPLSVVQAQNTNDLNALSFNAWHGRGFPATNIVAAGGTIRVGWFDNIFPTNVPSTMLAWAWPDAGSGSDPATQAAAGYSWNGTHDSGWVSYVGYEVLNPASSVWDGSSVYPFSGKSYSASRVRANGSAGAGWVNGSSPTWVFTATSAGSLQFDVSAYAFGGQPNLTNDAGVFYLGIYSVAAGQWLANSSAFKGDMDYFVGTANITASVSSVSPGDQFYISYHGISGAGDAFIGGSVIYAGLPIVAVTAQPLDGVVAQTKNFTLTAIPAGGTGIYTYQWLRNGAPLSGETGVTLVRSNVTPANAGNYQVVLTSGSSVTSSVVAITVVGAPLVSINSETGTILARLGDLFPNKPGAPVGSHAWPGNNGLNRNFAPNIPNATNIASTVPSAGSWRVGWVNASDWSAASWGNPGAVPSTMGGWIWPESASAQPPATLGAAQGYSWAGDHDNGWVGQVGFETASTTMPARNNTGSFPLAQWTATAGGTYDITFTIGDDWSGWPSDFTGFGIWSTTANAYVADDGTMLSWAPSGAMNILARPAIAGGPYTITASNVNVSAGGSLYFVVRTLGSTLNSGYSYQGITISQGATVVAQLGDLFPDKGGAPAGSHAWPGNNGRNTNMPTSPVNGDGILDSGGRQSWRVGWVEASDWSAAGWGNPGVVPYTMGGWIWPNSGPQPPATLGNAQGYSWAGNHDEGWVGQVGFETGSTTMPARNNSGSFPLLEWTAPFNGAFNVSFTIGNDASSWPNDKTGFGIWSTYADDYVADTSTMLSWAPPNTPTTGLPRTGTPRPSDTITASNVVLTAGESLYFVARTLGATTQSSYSYEGITIQQAGTHPAIVISGTAGFHYRVDYANAVTGPWTLLADIPALPSASFTVSDAAYGYGSTRFYRVSLIP